MHRQLCTVIMLLLLTTPVFAQAAPDWTLTAADGDEVHAVEVWKQGPTILFFWATWCPYCKALMPHLQSMLLEYDDPQCPLKVYAFSFREDGDPGAVLEEQGFDFAIFPEPGDLPEQMGVVGTPGLFVVDTSGEIVLNLYQVSAQMQKDPEVEKLGHRQKAARRAPYWAARIRAAVDATYTQAGCADN